MSGAAARKRSAVALTLAAETYERLVVSGELKGDAFRAAMATMRNGMRTPSVVPVEMPGLIEGLVRSQVAGDLQLAMRELRTGTCRTDFYAGLRMLVAHVLLRLGYHPKTIGLALNRDRSTIIQQQEVFTKRLAADQLLVARVERLLAAAGKDRLSCAS